MTTDNLLNPTILDILSKESSWTPLADSITRKGCHCQNFHLDYQYIIKLFRFPSDKPQTELWWEQEHQALHTLKGELGSPISYGYMEYEYDGFTTIYLFKEMVAGQTLGDLGQLIIKKEQCQEVGELLADIHNHKVVTGDCHLSNLLVRESNNKFCFIDFGNARCYPKPSFIYGLRAARDLQKAKYKCANLDPELSQIIEEAYLSKLSNRLPSFLHNITLGLGKLHQAIRLRRGKETIKNIGKMETERQQPPQ